MNSFSSVKCCHRLVHIFPLHTFVTRIKQIFTFFKNLFWFLRILYPPFFLSSFLCFMVYVHRTMYTVHCVRSSTRFFCNKRSETNTWFIHAGPTRKHLGHSSLCVTFMSLSIWALSFFLSCLTLPLFDNLFMISQLGFESKHILHSTRKIRNFSLTLFVTSILSVALILIRRLFWFFLPSPARSF